MSTIEPTRKTLILHTWGIGDMILLTPVLELLHAIQPGHRLNFAVFQWSSILPIQKAPYMGVVHRCGYAVFRMLQDIKTIRRSKYDQVIVTSGINPVKAGLYLFLTGIRIRCGDYRSQTLSFYTLKCRFDPAISRTLGNYHLFALLFRFPPLDRISTDIRFRDLFRTRYYFSKDSADAATGFLNSALSPHSFIVAIHPGCNAQNRYRRWNPEYFITLITLLRTRFPDWGFYIIAGPDEKEEGNMISRSTGSPLLTDVSLDIVAATLQQSHLLINTDSGIGHIASCFHLRTYTIFGPGDERQTAPQNPRAKVIRSSLPCAPCNQRKITRCQAECLSSLTPELVAEGIVKDYDERQ